MKEYTVPSIYIDENDPYGEHNSISKITKEIRKFYEENFKLINLSALSDSWNNRDYEVNYREKDDALKSYRNVISFDTGVMYKIGYPGGEYTKYTNEELQLYDKLGLEIYPGAQKKINQSMDDWF